MKRMPAVQSLVQYQITMEKPLGLPRHMSPRPQGFEEPNQWKMARLELPPSASAFDRAAPFLHQETAQAGSQSLVFDEAGEEEDDPAVLIPIRQDPGAPPNGQPQHRPCWADSKTPTVTSNRKVGPPCPPSAGSKSSGAFSRRHVAMASAQQARHDDVRAMPASEANSQDTVSVDKLIDLFFPPVHAQEQNNRRLPVENNKWGFGGSSRNTAGLVDLMVAPMLLFFLMMTSGFFVPSTRWESTLKRTPTIREEQF